MKQYLTPDQTAKLIELGFDEPISIVECMLPEGKEGYRVTYSIGELIEMLNSVSELEIIRFGSGWEVGDDLRAFKGEELIDALYDMLVQLKEKGVI